MEFIVHGEAAAAIFVKQDNIRFARNEADYLCVTVAFGERNLKILADGGDDDGTCRGNKNENYALFIGGLFGSSVNLVGGFLHPSQTELDQEITKIYKITTSWVTLKLSRSLKYFQANANKRRIVNHLFYHC